MMRPVRIMGYPNRLFSGSFWNLFGMDVLMPVDCVRIREANMMFLVGSLVFAGALGLAISVIAMTVAPQWRRIARLASGQIEAPFAPLASLAQAERRIAVRRWAAGPLPSSPHRMREAA
jgi:hypothetical protein